MAAGVNVSVSGASARHLAELSAKIKAAERRDLKLLLARNLRGVAAPAKAAISASALGTLPKRGGYAARVAASKVSIKTTTAGKRVGVRIKIAGDVDISSLNTRGRLRKPLFGDKTHWYDQDVEPGFVDKPLTALLPASRIAINAAMAEIEHKLT